ncbi:hypothetical protein [Ekhidna sp.]
MGKRKSRKIDWGKIAVEMISVIFAVLLALLLNEWRNNIKQNHQLDKARANLKEELLYNLEEAKTKLNQHNIQLTQLEKLADSIPELDQPFYQYNMSVGFLNLKKAVWESIILTDVVNQLEFSELSDYSELYRDFELIDELQNAYLREVFSLEFNKIENAQQGYLVTKNHLLQMTMWEGELISEIDGRLEN